MVEIKEWTALWDEPDILIVATMHAPQGKPGRFTVIHRCQKTETKLDAEKLKEEPVETDQHALDWAKQYADEKEIPVIYHCDFDKP